MRANHPNRSRTYVAALALALLGAAGCRNQQTVGLTNPFLAPDRVPPPSTRVITPGTAQPYYPGDPLPVMQSNTTPATAPVAASTSAPPADASSTASRLNFAAGHESPVGVPSDSDDLRYPLPAQPAATAMTTAPQPTQQAPAAPTASPVQQAAYNEPLPTYVNPPGFTAPIEMWRSPEIPPTAPAPSPVVRLSTPPTAQQPFAPMAQPPITPVGAHEPTPAFPQPITPIPAGQPMQQQPIMIPVRMQPVLSPQPQPVMPSTPRIRMPSPVSASMQPVVVPNGVQQAAYFGPAVPPGAVLQTVQITELPAYQMASTSGPTLATSSTPTQSTSVAAVSRDGFRPRGTTR